MAHTAGGRPAKRHRFAIVHFSTRVLLLLSVMLGDVGQTARLCTCSLPGNRYRSFFARLTCGNKGEGRYDHDVDCRCGQEILGKILYHTWARYMPRCASQQGQ